MADRISISCSNCGAGLKLDAEKLGKKIKCPKCNEVFVANSDEDLEEVEEIEEEEEAQPKRKAGQPSGRSGGKGGKKGAGKKSGGSGMLIALIGGGVALLFLLVGVGLYAAGAFGGKAAAPADQIAADAAAPAATPAAGPPAGHGAMAAAVPGNSSSAPGAAHAGAAAAPKAVAAVEPPAEGVDLSWFPPETEVVVHVRIAELWQSPLITALRNDPMIQPQLEQALEPLAKMWGLNPTTDVVSVSLAAWGLDNAQSPFAGMPGRMGPTPGSTAAMPGDASGSEPKFAAHLVLKQPLTLAKIEETLRQNQNPDQPAEITMNAAGPVPTLKITQPAGAERTPIGNSFVIGQPSASTLLIGPTAIVEAAIARGKKTGHLPRFNDLSKKFNFNMPGVIPQIGMLVIPKTMPQPSSAPPQLPPGAPPWLGELTQTVQQETVGYGQAFMIQGGLSMQVVIVTKTAEGSQKLQQSLTQAIETLGFQYNEMKTGMPPFATELLDPLVSSLKTEDAGSAVRVTAGLPDSSQAQIAQLPAKIMGYMLTASLKAPGAPGQGAFPGQPGDGTASPFGPGSLPVPVGAMIPPGTPAIPAKSATNLPDGASLAAKVYIKLAPPDRANVPPAQLAIALTLQGLPSDADFLQLGKLSFKKITANGRQAMKANEVWLNLAKPTEGSGVLPVAAFTPVPGAELVLGEALILPPRYAVNVLSTVEGTFLMRNGTSLKEFTVPDASSVSAETTPDDDELKSAGVKLRRETGKAKNSVGRLTETLVLTADKGHAFAELSLTDESGNTVPGVVIDEVPAGGSPAWRVFVDKETKLPPGLTLKGRLIGNIEDTMVSFRFDDLKMPQPGQNPGQAPTEATGQPTPTGQPAAPGQPAGSSAPASSAPAAAPPASSSKPPATSSSGSSSTP
ncbi:MAG TPA: zinc-ribbon domain-containing protein [Planctomycetaceae bacterium]|nr:zinc-ribbon domain-containing protein [Planctomycetaceae bacterium]